MKGFGTDEKALIRTLANKDPLQVNTIRDAYQRLHRRDLVSDIKSEVSGCFEAGLVALVRGPLLHDVFMLYEATDGPGTKEKVLNDVLLGRSNADINAIKSTYQRVFGTRLEDVIRGDLSMKTERHFMIVLQAQRAEDSAPVIPAEIGRDVGDLYNATEGMVGTDEVKVCSILSTRNDNQIRAIAQEYRQKYAKNLEDVIRKVIPRPYWGSPSPFFLPPARHLSFLANSPPRSFLATWRTLCFTSCATPWINSCTRHSCSRTPWRVLAPRTISS